MKRLDAAPVNGRRLAFRVFCFALLVIARRRQGRRLLLAALGTKRCSRGHWPL